jgi:hypothetical protein
MKYLVVICLFLGITSFPAYCENNGGPITLLQVLSNPAKFNGHEIQIIGFLHLEFEGDGLYLHKEDFDQRIIGNMIWVDKTADMEKRLSQINDKYVLIRGTFDADDHGHMGLFSGTLKNVTRCVQWPPKQIQNK